MIATPGASPVPARPTMDPQTEMLMAAIATMRTDMQRGFDGVHERLDALNGRTRKNSEAIAVLDERTGNMTCIEHAERFRSIEKSVERLEQAGPTSLTRGQQVKQIAITGGSVAALFAIAEGLAKWLRLVQ